MQISECLITGQTPRVFRYFISVSGRPSDPQEDGVFLNYFTFLFLCRMTALKENTFALI